jgi:hypothetical protein
VEADEDEEEEEEKEDDAEDAKVDEDAESGRLALSAASSWTIRSLRARLHVLGRPFFGSAAGEPTSMGLPSSA